jgi:hypothetical protein
VINTDLEASLAPVNPLNSFFTLKCANRGIDVLGDNISSVHEAASHIFVSVLGGVATNQHICRFEYSARYFISCQSFMVSLLSGDERCVGTQGEMDSWVGHQVGLELSQVAVQVALETQTGCDT